MEHTHFIGQQKPVDSEGWVKRNREDFSWLWIPRQPSQLETEDRTCHWRGQFCCSWNSEKVGIWWLPIHSLTIHQNTEVKKYNFLVCSHLMHGNNALKVECMDIWLPLLNQNLWCQAMNEIKMSQTHFKEGRPNIFVGHPTHWVGAYNSLSGVYRQMFNEDRVRLNEFDFQESLLASHSVPPSGVQDAIFTLPPIISKAFCI